MIGQSLRGDFRRSLPGREWFVNFDGGEDADAASAEVKFARLPGGQAFLGELRWKTMRIGRRHERFGGQDPGGLMMTMLAGGRGGIHRDDNLGPQGADQPD